MVLPFFYGLTSHGVALSANTTSTIPRTNPRRAQVRYLKLFFLCPLMLMVFWSPAFSEKPIVLDPTYQHDRFDTQPKDIMREFRAFTVSYDSKDNDDDFGDGEAFGIPEWVAYEIRKYDGDCIPTGDRPSWFAEDELEDSGIAPKDASYVYSRQWRTKHPDWYFRGHLCMKLIAERMGMCLRLYGFSKDADVWESLHGMRVGSARQAGFLCLVRDYSRLFFQGHAGQDFLDHFIYGGIVWHI